MHLKSQFLCVFFFSNSPLVSQLFISNEWHESCSGRKIPVYNPSTGKLLCEVEEADPVSTLYITNESDVRLTSILAGGVSSLRHYVISMFSIQMFLSERGSVLCCRSFFHFSPR